MQRSVTGPCGNDRGTNVPRRGPTMLPPVPREPYAAVVTPLLQSMYTVANRLTPRGQPSDEPELRVKNPREWPMAGVPMRS